MRMSSPITLPLLEDHVLAVKFRAASQQKLEQLAATIQTCTLSATR
jgi:hypothetical protein